MDKTYFDESFRQIFELSIYVESVFNENSIDRNDNKIYAIGLERKIINHFKSIKIIFEGFKPGTGSKFFNSSIDFSGIAILTRAILESYLTFNFIYIHPKSLEERRFRFLIWHLSGMLEREGRIIDVDYFNSEEREFFLKLQSNIDKEIPEISTSKREIEMSLQYQSLKKLDKNNVMNGNWRKVFTMFHLSRLCGISDKYFNDVYKILCGHAHSSRLSTLQIQHSVEVEKQNEMAKAIFLHSIVFTAAFYFDLLNNFPEFEIASKNKSLMDFLFLWKKQFLEL